MQIDFHHGATYVIARAAGFEHPEAAIIAYCAQYVDDCTSEGTVHFDNRAVYNRISSAHKMLDIRNTVALANHQVWLAFHFLPGNGGFEAGMDPAGSFINKIVCRPNSPVAKDMLRSTILEQDRLYHLHRLGVVMHIFADTWAHQGFAGVVHEINEVEDAKEIGNTHVFDSRLKNFLNNILDDTVPPLGHGRANVFPDMPFLSWTYRNGRGDLIERHNTRDYCEAADEMCKAMKRYRIKDPDAEVSGLPKEVLSKMRIMFTDIQDADSEKRHKIWLEAIRDNEFGVGGESLTYAPRGRNSWKEQALGSSYDLPVHVYKSEFLQSNWKMFHDAIQAHRFTVVRDILPRYGICAA